MGIGKNTAITDLKSQNFLHNFRREKNISSVYLTHYLMYD